MSVVFCDNAAKQLYDIFREYDNVRRPKANQFASRIYNAFNNNNNNLIYIAPACRMTSLPYAIEQ